MPQIPVFTNNTRAEAAPAALANPAAFGQVGEALARAGEQISGQAGEFAARYVEARRQSDAANIVADASAKLGEMQFRWSKTPDRAAAYAGFNKEAKDYTDQLLSGIQDPLIASHVTERVSQEATIRALDTQNAAWGLESATRRGQLETRLAQYAQSAASTDSDLLRAKIADDGQSDIAGSVAAGWLRPEEGAAYTLKLRSDMAEVRARQMLNGALDRGDADAADATAKQLSDPGSFPGLLPERREVLASRAENVAYRLGQRDASRLAHQDAESARQLRETQTINETNLLADVYAGKQVDPKQLEALARGQQISPAGLEAVHSAMQRSADRERDDPGVTARLWAGTESGGATSKEDVLGALTAGRLKTATAAEMMRTLNERAKQQNDAVERGAFATLKTITSGAAVEQGLIKDETVRAKAEQAWAQAQGEWNRRVIGGREDPMAVLSDMAPKYGSVVPPHPTWLPQPKSGPVQSLEDVKKSYGALKAARAAGAISDADLDNEARVLDAYRSFYVEKAVRDGANTKIPFAAGKAPAAAKAVE